MKQTDVMDTPGTIALRVLGGRGTTIGWRVERDTDIRESEETFTDERDILIILVNLLESVI